ncbi:cytochrome ubiquinol oxidase subunit I [Candidatus Magnetobacterium casense]|uniref:Cytochrome ubiquinol oxidase subunit I n=1 Tax=Candidatus Magnetobacterium casense TaxID=1455061 RepID=A0ABS6RU99_9BACT|nr:cytochrome ubiquinol oxidase subunit I [Candidatus Magnetobacterium casensis]MBV6340201.1 cytochrome ubiquinol oxidase subunit I [Candidatus Magnetobacterium casensis]
MSDVSVKKGLTKGLIKLTVLLGIGFAFLFILGKMLPAPTEDGYRLFPVIGSRVWVWIIAQLHLNFAAFVLGVPIFAVSMEFLSWRRSDERLDRIAYDFTKLFTLAYTITAGIGTILLISLPVLYPKFMDHMMKILGPTWWLYIIVMYVEVMVCYYYYYSWHKMKDKDKKGKHVAIGGLLNVMGVMMLLITSAWVGYMTTPAGVSDTGELLNRWQAIKTHMWIPLSIHRLVANVVFGAGIAASYAAYRFITSETDEDRAYYDWMGYTSAMISIGFSLILPGVGYLLGVEIYSFNEQMGIQLMGGFFAWLWVMQAILIGAILMFVNYYLWISLNKMPGGERYFKYVRFLFIVMVLGYAVWLTPHSVALSLDEARKMGTYHPVLGNLGVMAAKNTAVVITYLATFLSFAIFKMSNKEPVVSWAKAGNAIRGLIVIGSTVIVLIIGVYSYMVSSSIRVKVLSPIQFGVFFLAIIALFILDAKMFKNAKVIGEPRWGKMPERSQYALIGITVTFTWLMGMMGYMRSGGRQYWHVYGIMKDTGVDAFLPTHGFASVVTSILTVIFFALMGFLFYGIMKLEKKGGQGGAKA